MSTSGVATTNMASTQSSSVCSHRSGSSTGSLIVWYTPFYRHIGQASRGATLPEWTKSKRDVKMQPLWHEDNGHGLMHHGGDRQQGYDRNHSGDRQQGYDRSQRQGPQIGEAGNRLIANSLPYSHSQRNQYNGNSDQYQNQYQGVSASGGRSGTPNGPPQSHGRGPYEKGYQSTHYNGGPRQPGGHVPRESSHYNDRAGYHSRGPPSTSPYVQPQYPPVNGFYVPQSHQALAPAGGPPIGGPGLLQQGVVAQQGGYPQSVPMLPLIPGTPEAVQSWGHRGQGSAQAPGLQSYQRGAQNPVPGQAPGQQNYQRGVQNPGPVQAPGQQSYQRGVQTPVPVQAPGQQSYQRGVQNPVPVTNSYSSVDNRSRGPQGRGRGGSYHNQNRY